MMTKGANVDLQMLLERASEFDLDEGVLLTQTTLSPKEER